MARPKSNREIKKTYTVAILPSLYTAVQDKAYAEGTNVSELIEQFFKDYLLDKNKPN